MLNHITDFSKCVRAALRNWNIEATPVLGRTAFPWWHFPQFLTCGLPVSVSLSGPELQGLFQLLQRGTCLRVLCAMRLLSLPLNDKSPPGAAGGELTSGLCSPGREPAASFSGGLSRDTAGVTSALSKETAAEPLPTIVFCCCCPGVVRNLQSDVVILHLAL